MGNSTGLELKVESHNITNWDNKEEKFKNEQKPCSDNQKRAGKGDNRQEVEMANVEFDGDRAQRIPEKVDRKPQRNDDGHIRRDK